MDSFERKARRLGYRFIAGIDEAGRGPLAGPVVAAAVIFTPGYRNEEIGDSKKLTPLKRERLYSRILHDARAVGIGTAEHDVIDRVNILQATLLAMEQAVASLSVAPDYLLIDGLNTLTLPIPQEAIIRGDSRSLSVAAASIIAKVSRDRIMDDYHDRYPQYNFRKNKGYPTKEHREAIATCGRCDIHRRSFRIRGEL